MGMRLVTFGIWLIIWIAQAQVSRTLCSWGLSLVRQVRLLLSCRWGVLVSEAPRRFSSSSSNRKPFACISCCRCCHCCCLLAERAAILPVAHQLPARATEPRQGRLLLFLWHVLTYRGWLV
jgi:hypothetical protein